MDRLIRLTTDNFNPRPHAGDDGAGEEKGLIIRNFNPRPHAGDDVIAKIE